MPLPTSSVYPPPSADFFKFASRRSVVHSTEGIVACSQPLAAKCGIEILHAGGNAAVGPFSHIKILKGLTMLIYRYRMPLWQLVCCFQTEFDTKMLG